MPKFPSAETQLRAVKRELRNVCPVCEMPDNDHLDWCPPQAREMAALEKCSHGIPRQFCSAVHPDDVLGGRNVG